MTDPLATLSKALASSANVPFDWVVEHGVTTDAERAPRTGACSARRPPP